MKRRALRVKYRNEVREMTLDAARRAFLREGYESVSMRRLAEELGCSHGTIYLHFKNKDEIFDALVEQSFAQLAKAFKALAKSGRLRDPVRALKEGGQAYVQFGLRNPGAYEFAFVLRRPGRRRPGNPHPAYVQMRSLVQRCIDEKRFRAIDVDLASQILWTAGHGVTSLLILRPAFPWADKQAMIRQVIENAVDGLVRRPTRGLRAGSRARSRPPAG
jgi:AcrR family transcriptional regulator